MAANRVLASTTIKSVLNNGRTINVKYATETDTWKRYLLSQDQQDQFIKAIEKADIPAGATTAIMT
jgi:hypothetical protein